MTFAPKLLAMLRSDIRLELKLRKYQKYYDTLFKGKIVLIRFTCQEQLREMKYWSPFCFFLFSVTIEQTENRLNIIKKKTLNFSGTTRKCIV